jgi:hypothetical protein
MEKVGVKSGALLNSLLYTLKVWMEEEIKNGRSADFF